MDRLARYAELAVRIGANVQPGQTLFVFAQPEHATLARAVVEAGWLAGAGDVQVVYRDDHVRRLHAIHAPEGCSTAPRAGSRPRHARPRAPRSCT